MNLHEYQAKELFERYGIPVPKGKLADQPNAVRQAAKELGGRVVVKAQVHAGGRGKAGGVKLVDDPDAASDAASAMLGERLVTHQTGPGGLPIGSVWVEEPSEIARELYLSALVDRGSERIVFMASPDGGMDIEEVAAKTPERIRSVHVDPAAGLQAYQARELGFFLDLNKEQVGQFTRILDGLYRLFTELDASLVEINPLIVTGTGDLRALDAKLNFDDNALFRHKEIAALRDLSQEDERERIALQHDLNYVPLDGNIGCMVNGAGLAMATMDIIQLHGGAPANFLDVGGGATAERVTNAFKLITSSSDVKAILVNIFGGIVRCDLIAEGIIEAVKQVGLKVPVVARLQGTNMEKGQELLRNSGLKITPVDDLTEAAETVVALARKEG
ncbi:ADP-forming succinate--CoA ligase subunit beta [Algiphilus sp.]|uniref:ADP-forming succinate--CoA ligase subunit beta n=1 Tax=Algiphilus sp. TaxID=1872431 RepID=UPI001CA76D7B|nr:ADP-forming succinate--CoA ligase subunit beta [Algiphilus sp.]MBY8965492.1 ADP-forming succinate--CoA ligase subunit beta [Algiphilus acroporae]MCI5061964.1 ADP-forming succinate--CoA ligase subunit beta [Algiphilus sp.]MCI5103536.1 ADP-forming succinate--CoA ligase subunit beta [Algiphilus sp.]MCR9089796.1 ADP-forming succinate--CoA ligase subunit beta [Pseudomonadota bacterium]